MVIIKRLSNKLGIGADYDELDGFKNAWQKIGEGHKNKDVVF